MAVGVKRAGGRNSSLSYVPGSMQPRPPTWVRRRDPASGSCDERKVKQMREERCWESQRRRGRYQGLQPCKASQMCRWRRQDVQSSCESNLGARCRYARRQAQGFQGMSKSKWILGLSSASGEGCWALLESLEQGRGRRCERVRHGSSRLLRPGQRG